MCVVFVLELTPRSCSHGLLNVVYGSSKQENLQPVGDLLLISSSTRVFSTGDFGNLAGAGNKETCLVCDGHA